MTPQQFDERLDEITKKLVAQICNMFGGSYSDLEDEDQLAPMNEAKSALRQLISEGIGEDIEVSWRGKQLRRGDTVPFDEKIDEPMDLALYVEANARNVLRSQLRTTFGIEENKQ